MEKVEDKIETTNEIIKQTEAKSLFLKNKHKNTISENTIKNIFYNILFAIFVIVYFFIINFAYTKMPIDRLEKDIQVFAGIFMLLAIFILERAYKKDNTSKILTVIEFLVLSAHSLSIMYIVKKYDFDFQIYLSASSYIFAIYFTLKSIIIYVRDQKKLWDGLSDIKEIVKKVEPIKKEAVKREKTEINDSKKIEEKSKQETKTDKKQTNTKYNKQPKGKNNKTKNIEKEIKPKVTKTRKKKIDEDTQKEENKITQESTKNQDIEKISEKK